MTFMDRIVSWLVPPVVVPASIVVLIAVLVARQW